MHESDRSGELRGTTEQLARVARCQAIELTHAVNELKSSGTADVTERNGQITVANRRMVRECKIRKDSALRQERYRSNADGDSNSNVKLPLEDEDEDENVLDLKLTPEGDARGAPLEEYGFDQFWDAYPRKKGRKKALEAWVSAKCAGMTKKILIAVALQAKSDDWTKEGAMRYIPHPTTWINQARWDDEVIIPEPKRCF